MGRTKTAKLTEEPTLEEVLAALQAKEAELAEAKALIGELHKQIAQLEANEDALGNKVMNLLDKADDKLEDLEVGGRRVKVLRKTISILGKIIVFSIGLKHKLQARNKSVKYFAWEELSEAEQTDIMAAAPHLFQDVDGDGVPDISNS